MRSITRELNNTPSTSALLAKHNLNTDHELPNCVAIGPPDLLTARTPEFFFILRISRARASVASARLMAAKTDSKEIKESVMATAIAADGKQYTICAYRRARQCAFCQRPRRRVSAFRIYNRKGQVIRADMLCASCLDRVIKAHSGGRYLFNITADMRRSLHIFINTHT